MPSPLPYLRRHAAAVVALVALAVSGVACSSTSWRIMRYLADRSVLAFLVVRNDTVVYETYRGGYGPATASTSFSVAKSVLSALVGIAVGEGAIRSVDDPVTAYVPELRGRPAFDGV